MTVVEFLTSVIKGWEEHLATDPSDPIKVTRDLYVSLVTMAKAALLDAQGMEGALNAMAEFDGELLGGVVTTERYVTPDDRQKIEEENMKGGIFSDSKPTSDTYEISNFFVGLDKIDETIAEGEGKKYDCVTCPVQNKDQCTAPGSDDCKARLAQVAGASVGPSLGGSEASKPG